MFEVGFETSFIIAIQNNMKSKTIRESSMIGESEFVSIQVG